MGDYRVVETTVPPGLTPAPDQATTVTTTSDITLTFVNPRIILQPTISTAQSFVPNDSATIQVEEGQGELEGTVRFELYDNATCSGDALYVSNEIDIATGSGTGRDRTVESDNTTSYSTSMEMSWAGRVHQHEGRPRERHERVR